MNNTKYFKYLEDLFVAHGGRPHWGKLHPKTLLFLGKFIQKWMIFFQLEQSMIQMVCF
jgi:hypothetical protein